MIVPFAWGNAFYVQLCNDRSFNVPSQYIKHDGKLSDTSRPAKKLMTMTP